ncbi:MAG: amino acid adenylation domain-containing protein [Mycobacterium sp.]|nr:amino acid adenylation domain-containing protein [Mycobacterium sp.]
MAGRVARWRERLAGSAPSQVPCDHARPAVRSGAGGWVGVRVEPGTVAGLRGVGRAAGGDVFDALVAAYAWWLHCYADSSEVVFGVLHGLRAAAGLSGVAGCCVAPVVLRCEVCGDESFAALVGRVRRVVAEALGDVVPFGALVAGLGVAGDVRSNPLFHAALMFRPLAGAVVDEWSLQAMDGDVGGVVSAGCDIGIELEERPGGSVVGGLVFSTDLFEVETVAEMASHWGRLLEAVAAAPERALVEHDLVTAEQRARQLGWNVTAAEGVSARCVHEVIGAQVVRSPDAVAVQVGDEVLTYRQLDERAGVIASGLAHAGVGPGSVVAMLVGRTPDLVAAIVGILKSGAAFVPLDPRQPADRWSFCITDAGADVVLTDQRLPCGGQEIAARVLNLDALGPQVSVWGGGSCAVSGEDLAYVIYTSGSTGRPKPVLIEHRGVTNLMHTLFREFGLDAATTVVSVASISFDMALGDIFCALGCGARLVLATAEQAMNPVALSRLIEESGASYLFATPTTWGALIAAGWGGGRHFTAVAGGETLTEGLAEALLQRCGAVWNGYGPTETTVVIGVGRVAEGDTVTVGRALPNVRAYIVDARGRLLPVGVPGEIAIGGVGVARGYLNRPDEQARRFGDDPFAVGGRLYRTGDRGRFLPDGRIQHLGRYDDQVKIRGFRIEPGEIESRLCEHPQVRCCAVVAGEAPNGEQQLVAYIVGSADHLGEAQAREWLRRRLPEYMVPSAFVYLNALPVTANGKLDKAALPAPARPAARAGARPVGGDIQRRIAALWADLLAVPVTDVNCDFFDMGGHSLLAARLIGEVEREFGVALSLTAFLDNGRTVAALAELLGGENPGAAPVFTSIPPLHFIFSDVGSAMSLRHFTEQWGAAQPVHALTPAQPGGLFDRSVSIEQHASDILSAIRARQPQGPLALVGYSIGGLLAYEVARQAVAAGQQVNWLGILDAEAPSLAHLQLAQLTLRWKLRWIRQKPARQRWATYAQVARRLLASGTPWPQDNGFDYRGATQIASRYQLPGHDLAMHLFIAQTSAAAVQHDLLGWAEFHQGPLTAHHFPGDHVTLLQPPKAHQIAHIIHQSLHQPTPATTPTHN